MKTQTVKIALGLIIFCSALLPITNKAVTATNPPPTRIVMLQAGADVDAVIREFQLQPKFIYRYAIKGFAAPIDSRTLERLKQDARVVSVGENGEIQLACSPSTVIVPASELETQQIPTGIVRMGLTNFPMTRYNGQDYRFNVDVAVLDSGIQLDHPDLNVYLAGSMSFNDDSTNGSDWNGHGTWVGGILGALDNEFGVVGVAPGVRLWSVEVIGPNDANKNNTANVLAGVDYVAQHADQIAVVNCSFAGQDNYNNYNAIHAAFSNLVNRGVVVVAGAGNGFIDLSGTGDWGNYSVIPAGLPEVMAVSAMDPNPDWYWDRTNCVWLNTNNPAFDQIADFSNYSLVRHDPEFVHSPGAAMDVAAPGVFTLSAWNGTNYAKWSGTSAACPHAAGLVALYIAANGRATNAEGVYKIRQAIVDSGQPQSAWHPTSPTYYGWPNETGTADPDGNFEPLAVPSETWVPAPRIVSQSVDTNGFNFSFTTTHGYLYTAQLTEALSATNSWTDLVSTNGTGDVVAANDPSVSAARYYRVKRQPTP